MLVFKARRRVSPALRQELTPSERRVIRETVAARRAVQDWISRNEGAFIEAVAHRPWTTVANMLPSDPWIDYQEYLQNELLEETLAAGDRAVATPLAKATPALGYRFDRTRPEASLWASTEAARLVTEITDGQRTLIRDLISRGQVEGIPVVDTARIVRQTVGLTTQQAEWVSNFYDRNLGDNLAGGMSLAQATARAEAATGRYHDRIHRYRAETIARTEVARAAVEGRQIAWKQGIEEGFVSPLAQKEWIAEPDACEICAARNGQRHPVSDPWPDGEPPAHPNCRCDLLLVPEPIDPDLATMTDEEIDAEIQSLLTQDVSPALTDGMPYELDPTVTRPGFNEQIGRRSRAVKDEVAGDLQRSFAQVAQQEVQVRVPGDVMGLILDDGRLKTAFELSDNMAYMEQRQNIEGLFVGVPADALPGQRPIYGAINNYSMAERYGEVSIVLDDSVKSRTTFSVGDSFNGVNPVSVSDVLDGNVSSDDLARGVSDFDWSAISRGGTSIMDSSSGQYWEAQVHGGVSLTDISRIEVPDGWLDTLSPSQRAALDRSGIDVVVV